MCRRRSAPAASATSTRRPVLIVAHLADLMAWGITLAQGQDVWKAEGGDDWDVEVPRFFDNLAPLDRALATAGTFDGSAEKLVQGPLADALTHVGQLAMLRGMSGRRSGRKAMRAPRSRRAGGPGPGPAGARVRRRRQPRSPLNFRAAGISPRE